jgi:Na+-translocating ferredoxin:NAD+ oxidoreductase RnfC subunit
LHDEITIENFEKAVKNTRPYVERTIVPKGAKVSFKSMMIVRFQYLARKAFRRR